MKSLHAWRAFARAYPSETGIGDHITRIPKPELPLPRYLSSLNGPCAQWTTFLRIYNVPFSDSEYAHIADLDNLVALELGCGDWEKRTPLHYLFVRRLSEQARFNGKLARLAVLSFIGKTSFDERLFRCLSAFPALKHCVLPTRSIPKIEHLAESNGWERQSGFENSGYRARLQSMSEQPKHERKLSFRLGFLDEGQDTGLSIWFIRKAGHEGPEQVRLAPEHCEGQVMEMQNAPQAPPKPRNRAIRSSKCRSMDCMLKEYERLS